MVFESSTPVWCDQPFVVVTAVVVLQQRHSDATHLLLLIPRPNPNDLIIFTQPAVLLNVVVIDVW